MNKAFRSRLEQNQDKDDLLSAFMHDYQIKDMQCPHLKHVGAQMKSLNIVGFTTTTSAFGWVFAMLLSHPEWQKKIADEIKAVCKDKNPTYEDYKNLRYTQAFVSEVLRLYPSLRMIPREVKEDDCVEGYHIPAGSAVLVSLYHMQRHKDYWERPEEFDPNRFINKPFGQDDPIAYKPFGIGKRICLGKDFALLELGLVTAMLLRKFHLVTPDPFEIKVQYLAYVFMYPQLGNVEIVKADS
jgi:cytochrome P450